MPAGREQLTSGVQGCPVWLEHDTIFFLQTQVASFCGWVKTVSSHKYFPVNLESNIFTFQLPDKIAKASPLPSLVVHVLSMFI